MTVFAPSRSSYYSSRSSWPWTRWRFVFKASEQRPLVWLLCTSLQWRGFLLNLVTSRFNLYSPSSWSISPTETHALKLTIDSRKFRLVLSLFCLPPGPRLPVITPCSPCLFWHCTSLSNIQTNVILIQTYKWWQCFLEQPHFGNSDWFYTYFPFVRQPAIIISPKFHLSSTNSPSTWLSLWQHFLVMSYWQYSYAYAGYMYLQHAASSMVSILKAVL